MHSRLRPQLAPASVLIPFGNCIGQELTTKSLTIVTNSMKYFTGVGTQVGQRISILSEVLSTREEPPRIWYSQSFPTTPRLNEQLQINVLEVQEHLETYFDRKENVMEVMPNACEWLTSVIRTLIICTV